MSSDEDWDNNDNGGIGGGGGDQRGGEEAGGATGPDGTRKRQKRQKRAVAVGPPRKPVVAAADGIRKKYRGQDARAIIESRRSQRRKRAVETGAAAVAVTIDNVAGEASVRSFEVNEEVEEYAKRHTGRLPGESLEEEWENEKKAWCRECGTCLCHHCV